MHLQYFLMNNVVYILLVHANRQKQNKTGERLVYGRLCIKYFKNALPLNPYNETLYTGNHYFHFSDVVMKAYYIFKFM